MRKLWLAMLCSTMLLSCVPKGEALDTDAVKAVRKSAGGVEIVYPMVVKGEDKANQKINSALSTAAGALAKEALSTKGGNVDYEVRSLTDKVLSISLYLQPKEGQDRSKGLTFDRTTGQKIPLDNYFQGEDLLNRCANGLNFLYDVPKNKGRIKPDEFYVDEDNNVIGVYRPGRVLEKSEGEIEINITASESTSGGVPAAKPANLAKPRVVEDEKDVKKKDASSKQETPPATAIKKPVVVTTTPAGPKQTSARPQVTPKQGNETQGSINGTDVRMRTGAGLSSEIEDYFEYGESVTVLSSETVDGNKWYKVRRVDGSVGWVYGQYVTIASGQEEEVKEEAVKTAQSAKRDKLVYKGTITGTDVRVRADPGLDGEVLGYFAKGEIVTILDSTAGGSREWIKVRRASGEEVWVAGEYCREINE